MISNKTDNVIISNVMWHFAEKWGCQIISFIITVILARALEPTVYGKIAIVDAFMQIFTVFIDGGLGNALIKKEDADDLDFSTVLVTNIVLCSTIYLILFVSAPYIAKYYSTPELTNYLRVASIMIIILGVKDVQQSYIAKHLMFRKFFFASLAGTIGSGIVGIYLAYNNYGAWALIISSLFDIIVDTICMYIFVSWKPKIAFSKKRFCEMSNYGSKILSSSIIDRLYNKMYHLAIGKVYTKADLAYYDKGNSLTTKIADNTDNVISSVIFPSMSSKQGNKKECKELARNTIKVNTYIMMPALIGVIVICESLVEIVFTKKWLAAVPYIRLFCLINMMLPFNTINKNIVKSLSDGTILLKQEIIKKILGIIILIVSINISPIAIVIGKLVLNILYVIINSISNDKILDYNLCDQLKDVFPNLAISLLMGILVYMLSYLKVNIYLLTIIQVVFGIAIYILLSIMTKNKAFYYLIKVVKKVYEIQRGRNMKLDINLMHKYETDMFREICKICKENNLRYFAAYGTVLGSIRHKGPIPWDNDVDIAVPACDMDKFVEILSKKLSEKYCLDYFKINDKSRKKFPRIGLNGYDTNILHIDVYPLIGMPNDVNSRKQIIEEFTEISKLNNILKRSYKGLLFSLDFKKLFIKLKYRKNMNAANYMYEKLCLKNNYDDSTYTITPCFNISDSFTIKKDIYGQGKYVKYNDFYIVVPEKYDDYLTQVYGNYMIIPSFEERTKGLNEIFDIRKR